LSGERLITQLEMMTSTEQSGSGICSISPLRNSTLSDAGLALVLAREREHVVGHVEPVDLAGRTDARADSRTSMPPPDPRSSTVLADLQLRSAPSGCRSRATRRPPVSGSVPALAVAVQVLRDLFGPAAARARAAAGILARPRPRAVPPRRISPESAPSNRSWCP
jgi:hypothetical protein